MSIEKNDEVTKKPETKPEDVKKVPDQINSDDARKAAEHGGHPVSREQDEIGSKGPGKD